MTIIYLVIILISGMLFSFLFIKEQSYMERFSIGFGLGILIYSLGFFLLVKFGVPLNKENILLFIGGIFIILCILNCKNKFILKEIKNIKMLDFITIFKDENKYLWLIISILGGLILIITLFWPISEWDALTLYDFRGRVFSQGLLFKDVQTLDSFDKYNPGYYFSYPPSTSFIHASFYVLGSNCPQIIYPLIFFSLIIYFYKSLARYILPNVALLITGIFMLTNTFVSHSSIPYTNLPYTYYYFISTLLLINFIIEKKDFRLLLLSGIFLAGASWMRSVEPFYLVNILVLIYTSLINRTGLKSIVVFSVPVLLLRELWSSVQDEFATKSFLTNINIQIVLSNLIGTLSSTFISAIQAYCKLISNNIIIFMIFIICTILFFMKKSYKRDNKEKWLLIIVYANLLVIFMGVLIIGILLPGRTEIYNSIDRLGMFLFPFIFFLSGLNAKDLLGYKK